MAPATVRYARVGGLPCALAGATMGTTWSARLVLPVGVAESVARRAIQSALDDVVAQMSHWEEGTAITRYNRAEVGWQALPARMLDVLDCGLAVARLTGGAYDPTIGALVSAWGFGPRQRAYEPPGAAAIDAARARCGWARVRRDGSHAWQDGGVLLDFSSIAKGYGVDCGARALLALGVGDFLLEVGGELRAQGLRPDGLPWRVAIEWPDGGGHADHVVLDRQAIATSGDYRRYFQHDGKRHSHTLDPRSGRPIDNGTASVTVLHDSCMHADAWATALTVLGAEAGLRMANAQGLAALFVVRGEHGLEPRASRAFIASRAAQYAGPHESAPATP
ncbi:FAD:protein FMN transferase [Achromobacter aloeverae]|uniref:FAD:protein FMN transferase n=1 Tax=Achromobacter aloeverae TaxID=1750518 RepID=A0A4Q1HH25_9BURK|nr:FAD:protein FMN transferase [Achromobacter aloeverae]RXN85457.1 thiamine biosynthesis protein ApbE [Achromobacter aloeverae]